MPPTEMATISLLGVCPYEKSFYILFALSRTEQNVCAGVCVSADGSHIKLYVVAVFDRGL